MLDLPPPYVEKIMRIEMDKVRLSLDELEAVPDPDELNLKNREFLQKIYDNYLVYLTAKKLGVER